MLLKIFILSRNDGIFDIVRNRITLNRCSQQVSINIRNLLFVLWKEIRVGVLAGAGLGAVNFFRLLLTTPHSAEIALTVSLAMFVTVVAAKAVGAVLPLIAGMMRCDPAIMAAPLITTVVDAFALIMYFKIAQLILGL